MTINNFLEHTNLTTQIRHVELSKTVLLNLRHIEFSSVNCVQISRIISRTSSTNKINRLSKSYFLAVASVTTGIISFLQHLYFQHVLYLFYSMVVIFDTCSCLCDYYFNAKNHVQNYHSMYMNQFLKVVCIYLYASFKEKTRNFMLIEVVEQIF